MEFVHIGKLNYYDYRIVRKGLPHLYRSVRSATVFIAKAGIPEDQYLYARLVNDVWVESDGDSTKVDKMFIRKKWVDEHLLSEVPEVIEYPDLPDELILEDEEMFHDENGEVCPIKVVGERTEDGVHFCVKDTAKAFGIKDLANTILHKDRGYRYTEDYVRFCITLTGKCQQQQKTVLYFTYEGMLKVLFSSRTRSTKPFRKWATKILFTAQMGTVAQKQTLASKLVGVRLSVIRQLNKATSGDTPCVYLIYLGTGKQLRKSMYLSPKCKDNDCIYKYGRTKKLDVRMGQHEAAFKKIKGADPQMIYHAYIDIRYGPEAEAMIRQLMNDLDLHIKYGTAKELVCIPKKKMAQVLKMYDTTCTLYRGCLKEVVAENQSLRKDLLTRAAQHEADLSKKDVELAQKETELSQKDVQLSQKDVELSQKETELSQKDVQLSQKDVELSKTVARLEKKLAIARIKLAHATE